MAAIGRFISNHKVLTGVGVAGAGLAAYMLWPKSGGGQEQSSGSSYSMPAGTQQGYDSFSSSQVPGMGGVPSTF